jgi:hypothetical protein
MKVPCNVPYFGKFLKRLISTACGSNAVEIVSTAFPFAILGTFTPGFICKSQGNPSMIFESCCKFFCENAVEVRLKLFQPDFNRTVDFFQPCAVEMQLKLFQPYFNRFNRISIEPGNF